MTQSPSGGTFGLTIWLLLLPFGIPELVTRSKHPFDLPRTVGWIVAGASLTPVLPVFLVP